jgi:MoaA/NifB/PqqE/SkfB family radical SAM enzyme
MGNATMNVGFGHADLLAGKPQSHGWGSIFRNARTWPISGFHPIERDELGAFCWIGKTCSLGLAEDVRFLTLHACRPSGAATLRCYSRGRELSVVRLVAGWEHYDVALPLERASAIEFAVEPGFEAPVDGRELGLMLRRVEPHDDPRRHDLIVRRVANAALNASEYEAGATVLASMPPMLRLTMEVRCNIADKGPCVYCSWDWAKRAEAGAPASSRDSIRQFGEFLELAREVTDCSYGEPPLHRQFAEIVDLLADDGRTFSFTSNGQTLGPRVRSALLGRQIQLYVSIDSATSRGYARYRDDRFDLILENLRRLCRDKKAHDDLPLVTVSFIVMNSNKSEIGEFLGCMKAVGVDRAYLRALWPEDCLDKKIHQRDGFAFDYDSELIDMEELRRIGAEAGRQAREVGLWTMVEWENFPRDQESPAGEPRRPICKEPWKTVYALNRGITPCCYGRKPFAAWSERGDRSIPEFLRDVFNGLEYQELRRELAAGRLSSYCRESPNCPIVRRISRGR